MGRPYTQLYVHLVWATWDRLPLLTPLVQPIIYGCIQEQLGKRRCAVIAIGGIEDHVHVLTQLPSTAALADVVKHAKGASSNLMTQEVARGEFFKWQGYYGAFSLSKAQVPRVRDYVLDQEEHHRLGRLSEDLELTHDPAPSLSAKADSVQSLRRF